MANPHGRPRSETVKLTKTARERFDRQLAEKLPDIFTALFEAGTKDKLPYTIARGPTGGVMMHVADDSALYELRPKGGSDGKTYLGLEAPPGHVQDREILSISEREMVMRFVDPDSNNRYGTFVYVRCAA